MIIMRLKLKTFLLFFISCTAIAFGQSADYGFPGQRIGPAEGLTATDIYCIQEDDQSRMFVGTDKGLFIIEGNTIEQFSVEDGLVDNTIFKLYLDPSNRIWALTYSGGVCYFEEGQWKIPAWNEELKDILNPQFPYHIYVTENDNVLLQRFMDSSQVIITAHVQDSSLNLIDYEISNPEKYRYAHAYFDNLNNTALNHYSHLGFNPTLFSPTHSAPFPQRANVNEIYIDTVSNEGLDEFQLTYIQIRYNFIVDWALRILPAPRAVMTNSLRTSNKRFFISSDALYEITADGRARFLEQLPGLIINATVYGDSLFVCTYNEGLHIYSFNESGEIDKRAHYYGSEDINQVLRDSQGDFWVVTLNQGLYRISSWQTKSAKLPNVQIVESTRGHLNYAQDELRILSGRSMYRFDWRTDSLRLIQKRDFDLNYFDNNRFSRVYWYDTLALFNSYFRMKLPDGIPRFHSWVNDSTRSHPRGGRIGDIANNI